MKGSPHAIRITLRLALAAALVVLSPVAASAQSNDNLIVPGQRVGQIQLGMPVAQVYAILGAPSRTDKLEEETHYVYSDLNVVIKDSTQRVDVVNETNSKYRTREGVGVGSQDIEVRAKMGNFSTVKQIPNGAVYCYRSGMILVTKNGIVDWIGVNGSGCN
jgi:hypothetical protein